MISSYLNEYLGLNLKRRIRVERIIRVGTRGSQLATTQTKQAMAEIKERYPNIQLELIEIVTKGDRLKDHSLTTIGGQGAFVKEIEHQLLAKEIDIAIHSLKDLPTVIPNELEIGCTLKRKSPYDCLIVKDKHYNLETLPKGAKVGTSSLRRQSQLLKIRPDLDILPLRGNIDTRIKRLVEGHYDAIMLAHAGIQRLAVSEDDVFFNVLTSKECLPAIGQGALALQCRKEDMEVLKLLNSMEDKETRQAVEAERAFLRTMDGSCTFPIGGFARIESKQVIVEGMISNYNGTEMIREICRHEDPIEAGRLLGEKLLNQGAERLIRECQSYVKNNPLHTGRLMPGSY
ncbi:MAG TPA: hydroxymethylbilane synthase [Vagococcus sp.]|nr:hydroxymethylbilane synthase [Vagococcus sp.]